MQTNGIRQYVKTDSITRTAKRPREEKVDVPVKKHMQKLQKCSVITLTQAFTSDDIAESVAVSPRDLRTADIVEPDTVKEHTKDSGSRPGASGHQRYTVDLTKPSSSDVKYILESVMVPPLDSRTAEKYDPEPVKDYIKSSHQCSSVDLTKSSTSDEKYIPESVVASPLDSRPAGLTLDSSMHILYLLKNNEIESIERLFRENIIPDKHVITTAIGENGYNDSNLYLLRRMSDILKKKIPYSVGSWCGYRPPDHNCPVFVVTLEEESCVFDKNKLDKPFRDFDIIIRYKNVPNDEEKNILEKTDINLTRVEDVTRVHICIGKNTESLMREHSNLSIIRGSYVKSSGFLKNTHDLAEQTCIVFSVPVKGIIPIGEKEFTKFLDGIPTDVREGEFVLYTRHKANEYHHQLRMGCCISRPETGLSGTLGGFVDLPGNKTGCLTAAHVVLTREEINRYIMQVEIRNSLNDSLRNGHLVLNAFQPYAHADSSFGAFGHVHTIALQNEVTSPSVDAAIIEITNDERNPGTGRFPEGDFSDVGFPIDEPMTYNNGKILHPIPSSQRGSAVIKFGSTTGITSGFLGWMGTSARVVFEWGNYCFPTMFGQLEIRSPGFADKGDSGALAFICYGGNVDNLHAIGMVIGGSSTGCSTLITPIRAILQELGLSENNFKVFPPTLVSNGGQASQNVEDIVNRHERVLGEHSETLENISVRMTTMENNINQKIEILGNTIRDEMRRGFEDVLHPTLENQK